MKTGTQRLTRDLEAADYTVVYWQESHLRLGLGASAIRTKGDAICFPCAMATPERESAPKQTFYRVFEKTPLGIQVAQFPQI